MTQPSETPIEANIKVGDQWFYRGNRSPRWFARLRENGGLSESVEAHIWPILEQLTQALRERDAALCAVDQLANAAESHANGIDNEPMCGGCRNVLNKHAPIIALAKERGKT